MCMGGVDVTTFRYMRVPVVQDGEPETVYPYHMMVTAGLAGQASRGYSSSLKLSQTSGVQVSLGFSLYPSFLRGTSNGPFTHR